MCKQKYTQEETLKSFVIYAPIEISLAKSTDRGRDMQVTWHAWETCEIHTITLYSGKLKERELLNVTVRLCLSLSCQVRHITIEHNGASSKESLPLLLITNFTPSSHNAFDSRELLCALNTFHKQWKHTKGTLKLKLWQGQNAPGDQSFYSQLLTNTLLSYNVSKLLT